MIYVPMNVKGTNVSVRECMDINESSNTEEPHFDRVLENTRSLN